MMNRRQETRSFLLSVMEIFFRLPLAWASRLKPESALISLFHFEDVLRRYIDLVAIRYDKGLHPKHRLTNYHAFFSERIKPGDRVLDVGCGVGAVAYSLAESQAIVTGVDIDPDNIHAAKQRYSHDGLEFIEGDVTKGVPGGSYDVIVLSNVLEHVEHRMDLLHGLRNAVKPGKWLLRVPSRERAWSVPLRKEVGAKYMLDDTHFIEYTPEELTAELAKVGLSVKEMKLVWGEIWVEAVG